MSSRTKFVMLATFNSLLLLIGLSLLVHANVDLSKRLADLNLETVQDFKVFMSFSGGLMGATMVNFGIISNRKKKSA